MIQHQCLEFSCKRCAHPIGFSILITNSLLCSSCGQEYLFDDPQLKVHLEKFECLCRQLIESKEILSSASVGVDVGEQSVKIPFNLLLTRFNSFLELEMEGEKIEIVFRAEPLKDAKKIAEKEIR